MLEWSSCNCSNNHGQAGGNLLVLTVLLLGGGGINYDPNKENWRSTSGGDR